MTSCGIFPSGDFRPGSLRKATTHLFVVVVVVVVVVVRHMTCKHNIVRRLI